MKKEIFAAAIFALVLGAAIFNVNHLHKMTHELSTLVGAADHDAKQGLWGDASSKVEAALDQWNGADGYTHIFVRHSETDSVSESFYELLGEIYKQDAAGVRAASMELIARLDSIYSMERIRIGTIF